MLLVLTPTLLLVLGVLAARAKESWLWLSGSDYIPNYADLQQLTATADCIAQDASWTLLSQTCDPLGRAHNYPTIWAKALALLGVGLDDTQALGAGLMVMLIVSVASMGLLVLHSLDRGLHPTTTDWLVWTVACVSPPIWLAMDRGNTDIVVLAILVLGIALTVRNTPIWPGVIIAVAFTVKVFAFGSVLMLACLQSHRRITIAAWAVFTGAGLAVLWRELPIISARTPRSDETSFGVSVIPIRYQEVWDPWQGEGRVIGLIATGLFLAGLAAVLLAVRLKRVKPVASDLVCALVESQSAATLFLAGAGTFLVAYLAGTSYDYRMIFLLPCVGALLALRRTKRNSARVLAVTLVLLMWSSSHWVVVGRLADWIWLIAAPALALSAAAVAWRSLKNPIEMQVA